MRLRDFVAVPVALLIAAFLLLPDWLLAGLAVVGGVGLVAFWYLR